ncbi:MAG: AbrB/MazE/SpoVT family DNA-binding domain-containing protein [Terriglobia bacterium]
MADNAGPVVLPKPLQEELQLLPGDALEVTSSGEEVTLRPVRGNAPLRKKCGIWVYRTGEPISEVDVEKMLRHGG